MPALAITLAVTGLLTGGLGIAVFDRWANPRSVLATAALLLLAAGQIGAAVTLALVGA